MVAILPPLALSMGEPSGIGGEIALDAWRRRMDAALPPFFVIDNPDRLAALAARLGWKVPICPIGAAAQAAQAFAAALPVLPHRLQRPSEPGRPDPANADSVLDSIRRATALALSGEAAGLVTLPIHKAVLAAAGFAHPGHTEFLAALCGRPADAVMMLVGLGLRVVPATIHLPLRAVPDALTRASLASVLRSTGRALVRDFGLDRPRIAVAGLNPHAGEDGVLGAEEAAVIAPAIAEVAAAEPGWSLKGPLAADSLFHPAARDGYDAAVCMYHDQALIPLKTLDFMGGVNVTLGLPVVRTSPDHGTAFDLAGTGRADPTSLINAIRLAAAIARRRAR